MAEAAAAVVVGRGAALEWVAVVAEPPMGIERFRRTVPGKLRPCSNLWHSTTPSYIQMS